jgi:hypothetical protein
VCVFAPNELFSKAHYDSGTIERRSFFKILCSLDLYYHPFKISYDLNILAWRLIFSFLIHNFEKKNLGCQFFNCIQIIKKKLLSEWIIILLMVVYYIILIGFLFFRIAFMSNSIILIFDRFKFAWKLQFAVSVFNMLTSIYTFIIIWPIM